MTSEAPSVLTDLQQRDLATARLRPAHLSEAAVLDGIARAAKAHWGYSAQQLALWDGDLLTSPESIKSHPTWVAERHQATVGFGQLDSTATPWELGSLWVLPAHMGRGIGRDILHQLLAVARQAGQNQTHVDSDPHAAGFYRACGGVLVGAVAAPIPDAEDRVRPQFRIRTDVGEGVVE